MVLKKWVADKHFNDYRLHELELTLGEPVEEELIQNELDFYVLNLAAGQHFSIEGYAETFGTQMDIYNSRGKKIAPPIVRQGAFDREYSHNRYYGGIWNLIAAEAGKYIICISSGIGKYRITATDGVHGVTEGTIEVGQSKSGTLERFEFHRWMIDLTDAIGQQINIRLQTKTRDTWLELFGPEYEAIDRVGAHRNMNNKYIASIPYEVEVPGKYMLSVLNSLGPYTLTVDTVQKKRKQR